MVALREVMERKGLFCTLYSDRGAHFWYTPKSGGKVDRERPTQAGRAIQELRLHGIRTLQAANTFLSEHYVAEFNRKFTVPSLQQGSAFLPCPRRNLDLIFSQRFERTVDRDNK